MKGEDFKNGVARNIRLQMDINGKTRKEVCKDLGISYSTFSDWFYGRTLPRADKIELLADYFGCRKSDLVQIEIDSETEKVSFDISEIIARYKAADEQTKEMVRRILRV